MNSKITHSANTVVVVEINPKTFNWNIYGIRNVFNSKQTNTLWLFIAQNTEMGTTHSKKKITQNVLHNIVKRQNITIHKPYG